MFDQRNQQFSTILVATTIVLSGELTLLNVFFAATSAYPINF